MTASLADIPRSQRASGKESIGFGLKKLPRPLKKKKRQWKKLLLH